MSGRTPVVWLPTPSALAGFTTPEEWPAVGEQQLAQDAPDACLVVPGAQTLRARCSLWWTHTPPLDGQRVGTIGHFAATDAESTHLLLGQARRRLAMAGCTLAVGPMDGNTWRRYRFVTFAGRERPFVLEPTNPQVWPTWWAECGFTPLAEYSSALNSDLTQRDERVPARRAAFEAAGVTIRPLVLCDFEEELRRIYAVSVVSFASSFLYTPLPELSFALQYQAVRPHVQPELVFVAEQGDRPVGFSFSVPDLLEQARGGPTHTVIVKTVAILPDAAYRGLGAVLTDSTHAAAHALGFTRAVHALMYDGNRSRALSGRTATTMRRYTLFAQSLA
jgi:GNAT superfamily N-acetyltransferase